MTRRRRKVLIAVAAAASMALMAGGLWRLSRPRIDPRLVGAWKSPPSSVNFVHSVEFNADGRGRWLKELGPDDDKIGSVGTFVWWTTGENTAVITTRPRSRVEIVIDGVVSLLTWRPLPVHYERCEYTFADDGTLRMTSPYAATLRRVEQKTK